MNAKIVVASVLAIALLAGGLAVIADADDSAAATDNEVNSYPVTHTGQVNFSHLCLVIAAILLIGAGIIVCIAIYTKLYGDF